MPAKKKAVKKQKTGKNIDDEKYQPELSIGLIGHVDHGKTTLVKALSGKWTDTHSEELKRGITIRLGYADATIYKCAKCSGTDAYSISKKCPKCGGDAERVIGLSLVDAPGHESLMATMICGSAIMDVALLLVAANEPCPQPQTKEHIMALEIIGIKNLIVIQNKVDLVSEEDALKNYNQIKDFLAKTRFKDCEIIPLSAQHSINIDLLLEAISERIKMPERDTSKDPLMLVARSFDINKPGTDVENLKGGVLGGTVRQGILRKGQEIEILPGYEIEDKNRKEWKPLVTRITGLMAGGKETDELVPGGSIAVLTSLDPSVVKSDKLSGAVVGEKGKMPPVWYNFEISLKLLDRVVGTKDKLLVEPIKQGEMLMLNVNASATVGIVQDLSKGNAKCSLKRPVCAEKGSRVTISRRFGNRWRLIGFGLIR